VFTDPIEYISVSTHENLLHPKLQGGGLQFLLSLSFILLKIHTIQNIFEWESFENQ
jgi:hypothetical protein